MAGFSPEFIKSILLSGRAGPRMLSESAVQIDAWAQFADPKIGSVDLLLTPLNRCSPAGLAADVHSAIAAAKLNGSHQLDIAPLEGVVAVRANLAQFLGVILPATGFDLIQAQANLAQLVRAVLALARAKGKSLAPPGPTLAELMDDNIFTLTLRDYWDFATLATKAPDRRVESLFAGFDSEARQALVIALIWAAKDLTLSGYDGYLDENFSKSPTQAALLSQLGEHSVDATGLLKVARWNSKNSIWRIALNRAVKPLATSVTTIKADAARRVFDVDCSNLTWAVIDSGIDGSHPAFRDHGKGGFETRIERAFDFTRLRELIAFDRLGEPLRRAALLKDVADRAKVDEKKAEGWLNQLAADAAAGKRYDWETLSKILAVPVDSLPQEDGRPVSGHGTHVAGVLAGDWREDGKVIFEGVCPTLRLYDLRILGHSIEDTEFAVIAALEFIRWLNQRNRYLRIHGANMSIGLDHDVANFACGSTPVCLACEATVAAGVSIVVAAGNDGFQRYTTEKGNYSGYAYSSIADPGNARSVITVGSTHRDRPHEYGVSFFSSRGPTGDGRMKPDVVAPGEKIMGPLPNLGLGKLDGTSMSAPHVSGIAAMLMASHSELVGNPVRIKEVIVSSATDLGRDKIFQGAGLADALRALQSL